MGKLYLWLFGIWSDLMFLGSVSSSNVVNNNNNNNNAVCLVFCCFFADNSSVQGSSPPSSSGRHPRQIYRGPALPERADGREPEDSRLVNPVLCRLPAAKWTARALKGKLIHSPFTVWMVHFLCEAVRSQRVLYCERVECLELTECGIAVIKVPVDVLCVIGIVLNFRFYHFSDITCLLGVVRFLV